MAMTNEPTTPLARSTEGALASTTPFETVGLVFGVLGSTAIAFGAILYAIDPGVLPLAVGNLAFGAVCLTFYAIAHRRKLARGLAGRSTPLVALEGIIALGAFGAAFAANWIAVQNPVEWDLTRDGIYTLHPQSVAVAKRLERPVKVLAFYRPGENMRGVLREAVGLYRMHTSQLSLEAINPDRASAAVLKRFKMTQKSARIVMLDEKSGRFTKIKSPTEEAMTNALIEVAERRQRTAFFLTGHGEPSLDDAASREGFAAARVLLENEGLAVKKLSLVDRSDVPDEANVVIVAGPQTGLLPNEASALKVFVDRGGRALSLLEPGVSHGLSPLLQPYGVDVGDDLVLDDNPASRALGFGKDAPVVQSYETHPITSVMDGSFTMFFRARSVSPKLGVAGVTVTTLVQTSPKSWAETDVQGEAEPQHDPTELAGPVPIAVAVTKRTATHPQMLDSEARLVVVGDRHFVDNRFSAMRGNADLFVNAVNWLVGDEDRITIRPPKKAGDRLPITQTQQYGIMFFSVNLLPLLIVGVGFSVWAVRKRK